MKRIRLILAVGVVMAALLALNAGSALANEIKDFEIDGDEIKIELPGGGDLELEDDDIFGFDDLDELDDESDDDDKSINEGNDQGVVRIVDID